MRDRGSRNAHLAQGEAHEEDNDTSGELPDSADPNSDLLNNSVCACFGGDVHTRYVAAFGVGTTDKHEDELERRPFTLVGSAPHAVKNAPFDCTEDGWLEIGGPS